VAVVFVPAAAAAVAGLGKQIAARHLQTTIVMVMNIW
jgi:hypothetical protein